MKNDCFTLVSNFESRAQEASYNTWLNAKVQSSLSDPRPSVPHDQVMAKARALLNCGQANQ